MNYYNEIDPFAADWLCQLINAGHIAPGVVDTRSIEDITPYELREFTQCHFFAGIGVWSYALRQTGWPDDRPVWTGSCPCQPFSAAGKGKGFADERHLWPGFFHLIEQCKPVTIFGEQVASKDGLTWLDLVQTDLEGVGYTVGAVDSCAAGFGAPHLRQRLYWVADSPGGRRQLFKANPSVDGSLDGEKEPLVDACGGCNAFVMADTELPERREVHEHRKDGRNRENYRWQEAHSEFGACGQIHRLADSDKLNGNIRGFGTSDDSRERKTARELSKVEPTVFRPGPVNGQWGNADWLFCRDGKWRAVEPGAFPLADGATNRVGRLRGYGNAIVAPQAQAFIEAFMETENRR